jgi:hypothetical protein
MANPRRARSDAPYLRFMRSLSTRYGKCVYAGILLVQILCLMS